MQNTFGIPIIPANEVERLAKLYSYKVLGTYSESGTFKKVASMARHTCNADRFSFFCR